MIGTVTEEDTLSEIKVYENYMVAGEDNKHIQKCEERNNPEMASEFFERSGVC